MKKILIGLFLCVATNSAFAAKLEDVNVLDSAPSKDGLTLKLQVKDGPKDSYFFVNVSKTDRSSFDKLNLVIKKLKNGNDFKLSLDIQSFSISPPGSYYRSEDVSFSAAELEE